MIRMLFGGAIAGISFALASEYVRIQRGAAKSCPKCSAPVGRDGIYRGEREPSDHPAEWTEKQSRLRKMKCFGEKVKMSCYTCRKYTVKHRISQKKPCHKKHCTTIGLQGCNKPLDITSVIIFDRAWHKRCLVCANCKKKLTGNRYFMINNKPYDVSCFKQMKQKHKGSATHTIIDYRFPDPSVSIPAVPSPAKNRSDHDDAPSESSTSMRNMEHNIRMLNQWPSFRAKFMTIAKRTEISEPISRDSEGTDLKDSTTKTDSK